MSKKKTALGFSIVALIGGFLFLQPGITGNTILNESSKFNILSLVGFLLILCAIILAVYSLKKK